MNNGETQQVFKVSNKAIACPPLTSGFPQLTSAFVGSSVGATAMESWNTFD
jgi:hypothetical protein